jgi:hypothetical protein
MCAEAWFGPTHADMSSRFSFVLVVFFFAATLIVAVYLRGADKQAFYKIRTCKIEQGRLQQELWQKQLRVESLINPASIWRKLNE